MFTLPFHHKLQLHVDILILLSSKLGVELDTKHKERKFVYSRGITKLQGLPYITCHNSNRSLTIFLYLGVLVHLVHFTITHQTADKTLAQCVCHLPVDHQVGYLNKSKIQGSLVNFVCFYFHFYSSVHNSFIF